jgi:CheY-like chemotaxis protein
MADDDPDDILLATAAFAETGAKAAFSCVEDEIGLMDYLSLHSSLGSKGLPALILLDLNMPRKDGREVLREIKSEPSFQDIPIVILTTSNEPADMVLAKEAGAKAFITKPATWDGWVEIMKSLAERWLN